jgi:hypothetical protein
MDLCNAIVTLPGRKHFTYRAIPRDFLARVVRWERRPGNHPGVRVIETEPVRDPLWSPAEVAAQYANHPTEEQRTRVGCNYDGRLRVVRYHLDDGDIDAAREELRELLDVLPD